LKGDFVATRDMQFLNYLRITVLLKHSKWSIESRARCSLEVHGFWSLGRLVSWHEMTTDESSQCEQCSETPKSISMTNAVVYWLLTNTSRKRSLLLWPVTRKVRCDGWPSSVNHCQSCLSLSIHSAKIHRGMMEGCWSYHK
jgi:hypothetical protein